MAFAEAIFLLMDEEGSEKLNRRILRVHSNSLELPEVATPPAHNTVPWPSLFEINGNYLNNQQLDTSFTPSYGQVQNTFDSDFFSQTEVAHSMANEANKRYECLTQTDFAILECTKDLEISELRKENKRLKLENKNLKFQLEESKAIGSFVRKIFTEGQIRKMMLPGKNIQWNWNDISSAICLHAAGPRAYNHLYAKGFPLPHVSTLQRWFRKVDVREGILTASIDFMRNITDLPNDDKICVLAFDEMKVVEAYEYDPVQDCVRPPANQVQVVMARGLRKSWKQPVFFGFTTPMNTHILSSIISELHTAGFPVVAKVCDMGPTNRKLWKDLGVTKDKPWFQNPVNENGKIFAFADAPHLLKLIRNHFLDTGLICNKELLTTKTICDVISQTSGSDTSITFKLSDEHISVKGIGRQKVKLAAQLFSNTTANAIKRCYSLGLDVYKPIETANMIQLVNDWFDILNSTIGTFGYPGKEPFGKNLPSQKHILARMNEFMSSAIIPNKQTLEHFQNGILMTNRALEMLHEYVQHNHNMEYILTNRLNQDLLEHFFGSIHSKGGLNDHPTPQEFKFRLRKYILARNTKNLQGTGNVGADSTEWLSSTNTHIVQEHKPLQSSTVDMPESTDGPELEEEPEIVESLSAIDTKDIGILHEDALEYIGGYVIRKLKLEEYKSAENSFTWVYQVSKGSLIKPSPNFLNQIKMRETIFYKVNGDDISHSKNIQQQLIDKSCKIELPKKVKNFSSNAESISECATLINVLRSKNQNKG